MLKAGDIVPDLPSDTAGKARRELIAGAGEHKVLPDHQSQLVAGVVEGVVGIAAAAPDPYAVEVCKGGVLQQAAGALRGGPGQDILLGDIDRAHGENFYAVYLMGEALAVLVLLYGH